MKYVVDFEVEKKEKDSSKWKSRHSCLVELCSESSLKNLKVTSAKKKVSEEDKAKDLLLKDFKGKCGALLFFRAHSMESAAHFCSLGLGNSLQNAQEYQKAGAKLAQMALKESVDLLFFNAEKLFEKNFFSIKKELRRDFSGRVLQSKNLGSEEILKQILLGFSLALYRYEDLKSKQASEKKIRLVLQSSRSLPVLKKILSEVDAYCEGVFVCRDLQNAPGNVINPSLFHDYLKKMTLKKKISFKSFDEKKLKTLKMEGILAVGKGSVHDSRLFTLEYKGSTAASAPHFVIVGKGITFDAGGLSLKPAASMMDMKMDMGGSAAAVGIIVAAQKLKLPIRLTVLIPCAENKVGLEAINPGDVYTSYEGKTVEVLNTDAEGRLVMADALSYAKTLKPDCVFDIATLTGAVVVALGAAATGVMGNTYELTEHYCSVARSSGEEAWELPLYPKYHSDLKSNVADLKNISSKREAGASVAGAFLNHFVDGAYPWIHLDIAATSMISHAGSIPAPVHSATGVPVCSVVNFLRTFKKKKRYSAPVPE